MHKLFPIIFIFLAITPKTFKAQDNARSIMAKFTVVNAITNDRDTTKELMEAGAYTAFYSLKNTDTIYLANVWPNQNSESIGPISNVEIKKNIIASETKYNGIIFSFDWHFKDSYEDDQGVAKVNAIMIKDKPEGIAFAMKLLSPDNEFLEYHCEVDGAIKDRIFDLLLKSKIKLEN